LLSKAWLVSLAVHTEFLGIVFTNGTLFDNEMIDYFDCNRHIIPAISIEGGAEQTDRRRGTGIFATVRQAMSALHGRGIPFGLSITVTKENLETVCKKEFIEEYIAKGCLLFFYVEYVPAERGSEPLVLSDFERKKLQKCCIENRKNYSALFVSFPGNEEQYGGCLAAGRGFVHISAGGEVEPCPFAPFSDANISDMSLKDALLSEFLQYVRQNRHLLKEGEGGCALWSNKEFFQDQEKR